MNLKSFPLFLVITLLSLADFVHGEDKFETHSNLTYVDRGDKELKADVYVPTGDGPFPGVLMIHGGAWVTGAKWQMAHHAEKVATAGYTVVSINYRLAPKHKFPAQIHDCKEAVRWMRRNAKKYKIDPKRLAAYGYSAGGHLACLLGMTDQKDGLEGSDDVKDAPHTRLQAVVGGGAPCNFHWLARDSKALNMFLGGSRAEKPDAYRLASPTNFVTRDDPPVFFFHGSNDLLVPISSPQMMKKRLEEVKVQTSMHTSDGKGHIAAFFDSTSIEKAIGFLDNVLKKG